MRSVIAALMMDKTTFYTEVVAPFLCKCGWHSYTTPYKISRIYATFDFLFFTNGTQYGVQRCQRPGCAQERTVKRSGIAGPGGKADGWSSAKIDVYGIAWHDAVTKTKLP